MFRDILGRHGINNRTNKGKDLLFLIKSFNLKILLTYFQHATFVTYGSFSAKKSPHILDNFICCNGFFKRVIDCKTSVSGARSDHSAVKIKFKLTAIKLNLKRDALTVIDWEKNCTDPPTNADFNERLHFNLMEQNVYNFEPTDEVDYTTFNKLILQFAQATATKIKSEDKGWFHHSKSALLPAIVRRDQFLHSI